MRTDRPTSIARARKLWPYLDFSQRVRVVSLLRWAFDGDFARTVIALSATSQGEDA